MSCSWSKADSLALASLKSQLEANSPSQITLKPAPAKTALVKYMYMYGSILEKSIFLTELHIGHNLSNWESSILSLFNHWKKYLSKRYFKKNRTQGKKMVIKNA